MQLQLPDKEGITNYIILFVPMKKPKYVPKGIPRGMYLQTEDLGKRFPKNLKSIPENQKTSISSRVTVPAIDRGRKLKCFPFIFS